MRLAFREVQLAFRRAPLLGVLSVMTIAFSLYAFGLYGLVAINIREALRGIEERVEIRAFIRDDSREAAIDTLVREAGMMREVARVVYVTPESAYVRARNELPEFAGLLEGTVLPGSVEVQLKEGMRDPETVRAVANRLERYGIIDDVRYGREWVEKLYRVRNIAGVAGLGLGAVLALVATIIIGSTIRVAVLARAKEIEIMRMVGATNGFIRRPYLVDGLLKGIIGGLAALGMIALTNNVVSRTLVATRFFETWMIVAGIAVGALLGFLGSMASVSRHLRADRPRD
jgi:cell division transport system permease protein